MKSDSRALLYSPPMISQRPPRSRCLMALGYYLTAGYRVVYELAICFARTYIRVLP